MYFIDNQSINDFTDLIIDFPALQYMDDITKNNFKDILQQFFTEIYINKVDSIKKYLQFRIDDDIADYILKDYGVDPKIISNINPVFKKEIVYFIEKLFQKKGSVDVLQIFNKIFESLFSAINFYRIIVVKQPVTIDNDDGTKTVEYLLSYALEPLYINDSTNVLKNLDQKISLTGKFLMDLSQFKDFKVFPVNTNLVYMQFTSTEVNLDNMEVFSTAIKAYSLTALKGEIIPFRNFYNKYFDMEATDMVHVLFYLEQYRMKLKNPDFDFYFDSDKAYLLLLMDKDNLYELSSFLHEYKTLNMHDRKAMTDFKRRWKLFLKNYYTTTRIYHNFNELEQYIQDNYPEIIDIKNSYLNNDDAFVQFYIDMYLVVLSNVNIEDKYINLFINSLFLALITGESFIQYFFLPVYKIFQKYFFPIEMDFLAKIIQTIIVRDKFEALSYDQNISMDFDTKAMSKHYLKPDLINLYLVLSKQNDIKVSDEIMLDIICKRNENTIKNENIDLLISSDFSDNIDYNNDINILVKSFQNDKIIENLKENIITVINANQNDNLKLNKNIEITVDVSQLSKQKINESFNNLIETEKIDQLAYNEKNLNEIDRFNYTELYDKLDTYLIFEQLQVQTKTSNLTNSNFKYTREDDQLYFSIHQIF